MAVVLPFSRWSVPSSEPLRHPATAAIRHVVEDEIERLIGILDALDDDPDLEPGGDDEPSLGWLCNGGHSWCDGNVDVEVDHSLVEGV